MQNYETVDFDCYWNIYHISNVLLSLFYLTRVTRKELQKLHCVHCPIERPYKRLGEKYRTDQRFQTHFIVHRSNDSSHKAQFQVVHQSSLSRQRWCLTLPHFSAFSRQEDRNHPPSVILAPNISSNHHFSLNTT